MGSLLQKILTREAWAIAVRTRKEAEAGADFRFLPVHRDRFYADPILFTAAGRHALFFEDYRYSARKAVISTCTLSADGSFGEVRTCLERRHHLSYPFVFDWQDNVFMVPESGDAGRLEIYRSVEFPWRWELEGRLLDKISL